MLIHDLDENICRPEKIGISYGAGGQRGVIHLGVIKALIKLGIKPSHVVGASAGSIAATVHAFDPDKPDLVNVSVEVLKKIKPADFGISFIQIFSRILSQNFHLQGIGDFSGFKKIANESLPFKNIEDAKIPLGIVATNRLNGQETWFEKGSVIDAMIASSSVPGLFPPYKIGEEVYVDGAYTDGLPMFKLARLGCGTIVTINLGYSGNTRQPPANLADNLLGSIDILGYQSTRYETELIKALYPKLKIVEIRPEVGFDLAPADLTNSAKVEAVIEESYQKSLKLIPTVL